MSKIVQYKYVCTTAPGSEGIMTKITKKKEKRKEVYKRCRIDYRSKKEINLNGVLILFAEGGMKEIFVLITKVIESIEL